MKIFAYGSLIWNPGFDYTHKEMGVLRGYKRDFNVIDYKHRGDRDNHGLVLNLSKGGHCVGVLYSVLDEHKMSTISYLKERERASSDDYYDLIDISVETQDGIQKAKTFMFTVESMIFNGTPEEKMGIIKSAKGASGNNSCYFDNIMSFVRQNNLRDDHLFNFLKSETTP